MSGQGASPAPTASSPPRKLWIDGFQRRHPVLGFPIAVIYKFFDDSGPYLAALMTYYGLVSLFPLLLLLSTVLSIVLRNNPGLQQQIVDSAAGQFPVVGKQLQDPQQLSGGTLGVLAGLIFATYGGLGIGQALQYAMNTAWAVPRNERPNPLLARVRSLLLIIGAALVLVIATALSGMAGQFDGNLGSFLAYLIPVAILLADVLVFIPIFRHGTSRYLEVKQVLPGAVLAAICWALLQTYGFRYISHVIDRANQTGASGTNLIFATVFGLLAFIYLASIITVISAEVNVVLQKKLYPRALLTPFTDNVELTEGDRRTYTAIAQAHRHKGFERIEVSFAKPAWNPPANADTSSQRSDAVGAQGDRVESDPHDELTEPFQRRFPHDRP